MTIDARLERYVTMTASLRYLKVLVLEGNKLCQLKLSIKQSISSFVVAESGPDARAN